MGNGERQGIGMGDVRRREAGRDAEVAHPAPPDGHEQRSTRDVLAVLLRRFHRPAEGRPVDGVRGQPDHAEAHWDPRAAYGRGTANAGGAPRAVEWRRWWAGNRRYGTGGSRAHGE